MEGNSITHSSQSIMSMYWVMVYLIFYYILLLILLERVRNQDKKICGEKFKPYDKNIQRTTHNETYPIRVMDKALYRII